MYVYIQRMNIFPRLIPMDVPFTQILCHILHPVFLTPVCALPSLSSLLLTCPHRLKQPARQPFTPRIALTERLRRRRRRTSAIYH